MYHYQAIRSCCATRIVNFVKLPHERGMVYCNCIRAAGSVRSCKTHLNAHDNASSFLTRNIELIDAQWYRINLPVQGLTAEVVINQDLQTAMTIGTGLCIA